MEKHNQKTSERSRSSRAKWVLALSLCLCLISMIFSSAIQSNFGNVEVKELKLMDPSGYAVSVIAQENKKVNVFKTKIRFNRHIMESTFSARPLADISSRYGATMDYKKFTQEYLKSST